MPSTPDSILRLELQATSENATTWGIKTNNNIELLGQAIAGAANVNVGGSGNYTLVASNYATDEARAATLVLTGTLSGNRDVIVPSSPKHYTIINQTSGAFPLTIRQVSGTGVAIPAGSSQIVCTSTTCVGVGINAVSKTGDTMTGALGFAVGSSTTPGLFPAGDTNTGFFQAAAAPDTLSISVGGTEVARYGTGGFMRLAGGSAAAPVYSFLGNTNTGVFSGGANNLDFTANGERVFNVTGAAGSSFALIDNAAGGFNSTLYLRTKDASGTVARAGFIGTVNESFVPVSSIVQNVGVDGSSNIVLSATPAGARNTDRRVSRMTIPGAGAITMVGPVDVTSGNLNVTTGQLQVGGNPVTIQRDTEKTATGVSVDFTGIPAGVRRITVMFDSVSSNGTSPFMVQLGSTNIETINYRVGGTRAGGSNFAAHAAYTTGFAFGDSSGFAAAQLFTGSLELNLFNASNRWVGKGQIGSDTAGGYTNFTSGRKELAGVLDRLRITTVNGTDTFDAGTINVLWEF